jgi:hypothetical protein
MNCKQGDLAVMVGGKSNRGKLVEVLKSAPLGEFSLPCGQRVLGGGEIGDWVIRSLAGATLHIRNEFNVVMLCEFAAQNDRYLRPIRDNPGADETLTWAGKPEKVTA